MNKTFKHLAILLSSTLAFSCTSDEDLINSEDLSNAERRIAVIAEDFTPNDGTRTEYNERTDGTGYSFKWIEGDELGIFPMEGRQSAFLINSESAGTNTALFDGGKWALRSNESYSAYYPLNKDLDTDKNHIPVSFLGQTQDGNGDTRHLASYDYMASAFTKVDANGNVDLKLTHLGCLVQFNLTMPKADTFSKVEISSDNAEFISEGTVNLTDIQASIKSTTTTNSCTINLCNISTTSDNETLVINTMMAPVDLSQSLLKVKVYGSTRSYSFYFNGKDLAKGSVYRSTESDSAIPYITFTADDVQTLTMTKAVKTLEYSLNNGKNWAELGTNTITFGGNNGRLMLRGKNLNGTGSSMLDCSRIVFEYDVNVRCTGDIRTLLDYENHTIVQTNNARFCSLFSNCNQLISAPELPATTLANRCYNGMFWGCTSLTTAPELPAKNLSDYCYCNMFRGCTSLTTAPELPATSLADHCYQTMFSDCTSLTNAPKLPATNLAGHCYEGMFSDCLSLTNVPELKATTLADYCCYYMFSSCISLTTVPNLQATNLANSCYEGMFSHCISLTNAPKLPATSLADHCYQWMFSDCTSLTTAPELPATSLENYCYSYMFWGCTSLTTAPELPAKILVENCYEFMFYECSKLSHIKMMATDINANSCLAGWAFGVAITGIFIKNVGATWEESPETIGIPKHWIIEIATE